MYTSLTANSEPGKHIAQRLLATRTPVTVVDHIFYPDELGPADLVPSSLLAVHTGDIRNATLLSSVFTPDVIRRTSRVLQCEENPLDCVDVNERGTQLVLDTLEQLNRHDPGERWFVLASSMEVYGHATTIPSLSVKMHQQNRQQLRRIEACGRENRRSTRSNYPIIH